MTDATTMDPPIHAAEPPVPKLTAGDVDLAAPEYFDNPYVHYAHLRATQPVAPVKEMNAWLITRYADVKSVWLDDRLRIDFDRLQVNRMGPDVSKETFFRFGREFMAFADAPHHTDLKGLFVQGFTRVRAQRYLPTIRAIVDEVVDGIIDRGHGDIIKDFSRTVPLKIISAILGVPPDDQEMLRKWIDDYHPVIGFAPMTREQTDVANAASDGMADYFRRTVAERERNPGNDLISELLAVNRASARPIDEYAVIANLFLLYHAAQDTQKYQIGNAMAALHRNPDQLAYLLEDPARCWESLDELMRYDSVSQIVGRVAMEDVEISGTRVAEGQTVLLGIGASNRDPEVFPDPDRLDLKRAGARQQLAFGGGPHTCLGNGVARLSLPLMLEILLTRIPTLQIDFDRCVQNKTLSKRGFGSLPATWSC
jgi:cytochrome P450